MGILRARRGAIHSYQVQGRVEDQETKVVPDPDKGEMRAWEQGCSLEDGCSEMHKAEGKAGKPRWPEQALAWKIR